jgi:hypothetical protein
MATAGEKSRSRSISVLQFRPPSFRGRGVQSLDASSDFLIMRICDVGRRGPVNFSPRLTRAQGLAIAECRKAPAYHIDRLGLSLLER